MDILMYIVDVFIKVLFEGNFVVICLVDLEYVICLFK